jgi:hypothetical protein
MPIITKPISERAGCITVEKPDDELQRDLRAMASKHGLIGCVLVQFTRERVGTRSWAINDMVCKEMTRLADRIITDIDDGRHDPLAHAEIEGSA